MDGNVVDEVPLLHGAGEAQVPLLDVNGIGVEEHVPLFSGRLRWGRTLLLPRLTLSLLQNPNMAAVQMMAEMARKVLDPATAADT